MGSPLRIGVLTAHSVVAPLPEAVEMAKYAVNMLRQSELHIDLWVDEASQNALQRFAKEGCELLLYYGHGTEAGQLLFIDGTSTYSQLSTGLGLEPFWRELGGTILFACHSGKFAAALPCPWLAFNEEILRQAPRGFLHAWTRALKRLPLGEAIQRAHDECRRAMDSNFPDCLEFSARPWPELRVPAGTVQLRRASPGLSGRLEVDFASVVHDGRSYPEHDPFVGRVADLKKLMQLPDPASDRPLQQFFWVSGDPGIGKSALLRQHACHVRDLGFADEEEPVWLLHAYCLNCVQPRDVEQTVCNKARDLYGWDAVPESFHQLFKLLPEVPGIHVWILDDLTYLRPEIGKEQDSLHIARIIWRLINRAGYFTANELPSWFPTEFHVAECTISRDRAYGNGLIQLVRLGFLATRRQAEGDVYYMPPNQRLVMQSIATQAPALPASIPFRAPKAQLSSALERVNRGQFAAIGEILELEQEYADHIAEPEAAEAVAVAMMVRAELAADLFGGREVALGIYDDLVSRFGGRDELPLVEQTARALFNKGVRPGQLGRSEEEIAVYDDLVSRFGARPEPEIQELLKYLQNLRKRDFQSPLPQGEG